MNAPPFSDEVALRIGLAARRLGSVSPRDLIEVIDSVVAGNIDEASLQRVTVTHLKKAFYQSADVDGDEEFERDTRSEDMVAFKDAVRILWGEDVDEQDVPKSELTDEVFDGVRVAFASNAGEELNGHFGSCKRFLVYQVSADEAKLVGVRDCAAADVSDDKNGQRVKLILDCKILYVVHIGGPASAKVIKADIHLISVPQGGLARSILSQLQEVIRKNPPPWLVKALAKRSE